MKACPACGREIAESASACDTCAAWAAALEEPAKAPAAEAVAPAEAAKPAPAGRAAGSQRQLIYIAAGVAVVALTGFAISVRGGAAPDAPVTAAAAPGAARPAAPAAAAPTPTAATATQAWTTDNRGLWLGNARRGAAFELASENVVKMWSGSARPALVVRCTAKSIEAFVITRTPMKIVPRVEGKMVTISVDGEPARTEQWNDSDDRTAVFAPDPAAFVQRLRTARTLDVGYSPHNSSDVVAQFSVAGIDALLSAAKKECGASPQR